MANAGVETHAEFIQDIRINANILYMDFLKKNIRIMRIFFVQGGMANAAVAQGKYLVRVFSFQKIFASCEYFLCRGGWQTLLLHKILHCKCKYLVRVLSFQKIFASCEYFLCRGDGKRCC